MEANKMKEDNTEAKKVEADKEDVGEQDVGEQDLGQQDVGQQQPKTFEDLEDRVLVKILVHIDDERDLINLSYASPKVWGLVHHNSWIRYMVLERQDQRLSGQYRH